MNDIPSSLRITRALDVVSAERLLAGMGIRTDQPTAAIVARVLTALAEGRQELPPRLTHDEAGPIGAALARQWSLLVGTQAPAADDLVWADLVQFVLRLAREHHAAARSAGSMGDSCSGTAGTRS